MTAADDADARDPAPLPPAPAAAVDALPPVLDGVRCRLRPLVLADAPSLARHADDEAVWRFLFEGFPRPYTLADAEAWCGGGWRSAGRVWGIEVEGAVVGCVGLRRETGWLRCNAEAGWWLGRAFWRRGIASEAVRQATADGFAAWPEVTRIFAPVFGDNAASQALAVACGYTLEGRMPQSAIKAGRVIDRVLFATYRERSAA